MSKIRDSARGEACQIRLPSICNHDPATTVLAHANGSAAGKGVGLKTPDYLAAYSCSSCHDCVDRRRKPPEGWTLDDVRLAFAEGIFRTQRILEEKGLLKPIEARTFKQVCSLPRDHLDTAGHWLLLDGSDVVLQEQKFGKPSTNSMSNRR